MFIDTETVGKVTWFSDFWLPEAPGNISAPPAL